MKQPTYAAMQQEPGARAAAHIALMTRQTLDATLRQLRQLEAEGQIRSTVDAGSVVRWQLVPCEWTKTTPLNAEVMWHTRYFTPVDPPLA